MLGHQEDAFELPPDARNSARHLPSLHRRRCTELGVRLGTYAITESNVCLHVALNL